MRRHSALAMIWRDTQLAIWLSVLFIIDRKTASKCPPFLKKFLLAFKPRFLFLSIHGAPAAPFGNSNFVIA
jgi:hypothetical protein